MLQTPHVKLTSDDDNFVIVFKKQFLEIKLANFRFYFCKKSQILLKKMKKISLIKFVLKSGIYLLRGAPDRLILNMGLYKVNVVESSVLFALIGQTNHASFQT